ncbi:glycoside hydrolase family 130 protein [Motilibacter rhizosphaerae]|uniref:glycoside hydrolase family 130 protein n=1 Tax=Motilibacter rhizosphaerae TaxID=598652 RepID=UPI001E36EF0D|nr:glycoside hydrolase family 130 protein [Motilibacter rhizosphaerae]
MPDASRVLARLFVPGSELSPERGSRATGVLARALALPEDEVEVVVADVRARYARRHRDLEAVLARHYAQVAHRVPPDAELTPARRALVGAYFTSEVAVEGAALTNPSAVPHPDQAGLGPGELRLLLSVRAVGEGHVSSIGFRTGVLGPGAELRMDAPSPHVEEGAHGPTSHDRGVFEDRLADLGADAESSAFVVGRLPDPFRAADLETALGALAAQRLTRSGGSHVAGLARHLLSCGYAVTFDPASTLSERVLGPHAPAERAGMEDARLLRFVDEDGGVSYRATYTAYDGERIAPQLLETDDFAEFRVSPLSGPAARDKGLALFPRTVGGRHYALSRWDRETSAVAVSDDGRRWDFPETVLGPVEPWQLIQTGNCGPPIETAAGWLVLTHGVGPMREYAMGALLLDLDDPSQVLGRLRGPLLRPAQEERDGYVPNVVYSCGGLVHDGVLLLPYGVSDRSVGFATVGLDALLERLTAGAPAATPANSRA